MGIKRTQINIDRKQKNTRNFLLAIVALLIFAALLFFSVYFMSDSLEENESRRIFAQSSIMWNAIKESAVSEMHRISIDKNEILTNQKPDDPEIEPPLNEPEPEPEPEPEEPEIEYFGVAYLTFDDGPSRSVTEGILDLLAEEEIKATFFVISRTDVDDIYQRIVDEGHEIANHSYTHNYNRLYSRGIDVFREDILRLHNFVLENFGYEMKTFRFPGGSLSWNRNGIAARREVLEELGYIDYDWHIDIQDAVDNSVDTSAPRLTRNVLGHSDIGSREHVIILMHDYKWRQTTLEALPAIISGLREQGYRFDIMSNFPDET